MAQLSTAATNSRSFIVQRHADGESREQQRCRELPRHRVMGESDAENDEQPGPSDPPPPGQTEDGSSNGLGAREPAHETLARQRPEREHEQREPGHYAKSLPDAEDHLRAPGVGFARR